MKRMSAGRRVAVIGGGLAGITAALDCAAAGAQVTVRAIDGLTLTVAP